jgi:hypothetical protein
VAFTPFMRVKMRLGGVQHDASIVVNGTTAMLCLCNKSVKLRMHDDGLAYVDAHMIKDNVKKSTHNDVLMHA